MPYPNVPEDLWDEMDSCVEKVQGQGHDKESAIAICHASIVEGKAADASLTEAFRATWTAAYINDLDDDSFLYIESGGEKDEDGKTTPRSLRHFPYKGSDGAVDLPHLRNAIARIPQSNAPGLDEDKKASLQKRAQGILADETKEEKGADPLAFTDRFMAELKHQKKVEE